MSQIDCYLEILNSFETPENCGIIGAMEDDLREHQKFVHDLVTAEDRCFRLCETKYPVIRCPWCGGSGTDGFDRCWPPGECICQMCNGYGKVNIVPIAKMA